MIHGRWKIKYRNGRKRYEKERRKKKKMSFFNPRKVKQEVYKVQLSKLKWWKALRHSNLTLHFWGHREEEDSRMVEGNNSLPWAWLLMQENNQIRGIIQCKMHWCADMLQQFHKIWTILSFPLWSVEVGEDECISDFDSSPLGPFSAVEFSVQCHSFLLL